MKLVLGDESQELPVNIYLQIDKDGNVDILAKQGRLGEKLACITTEGNLYLYSEHTHDDRIKKMGFNVQEDGRIKIISDFV